jgi:hypothetical protein
VIEEPDAQNRAPDAQDGADGTNVAPAQNRAETAPPMPAIERVAEIFERLFVLETALVGELLAELACCTPEELHKLFGNPLTRRVAAAPATAAPEPAAEPVNHGSQNLDPHAGWRWDENGRRTSPPGRSAFDWTRRLERRQARTGADEMMFALGMIAGIPVAVLAFVLMHGFEVKVSCSIYRPIDMSNS